MMGVNSTGLDRMLSAAQRPLVPPELKKAEELKALTQDKQELRRIAGQFEAYFMNMMMKSMRQSVPKNPYMNGGFAEDVYTQMLDDTLTRKAVETGRGYGIAEMIINAYEKLLKK